MFTFLQRRDAAGAGMGGGGDAGFAFVYGVMRARACAVARM